jgi:hypothetical protein
MVIRAGHSIKCPPTKQLERVKMTENERLATWLRSAIKLSQQAYDEAEKLEIESDYHADLTMERKYEEGFLDALSCVMRELESY